MGTAPHPPPPCLVMQGCLFGVVFPNFPLGECTELGCGHLAQQTPNQKRCARQPMGVSKYTVNIAPSMGAPLQPPKPHLLESCNVSSQPTLAVPEGCSTGVAHCNSASTGWLLQGQGEDGAGGQQEPRMALPAVRGAGSIPVWHLDTAPSSLLSHGSRPRLELRSCSRAA